MYQHKEAQPFMAGSTSQNIAPVIQIYDEHNFFDKEGFVHVFFPFELTTIFNFFVFAPLLDRLFGLGLEKTQEKLDVHSEKVKCRVKHRDMSDMEKRIYYGLVKYPELPDYKIAEKLSTTRSTVMKMRERFYAEKLMRTTRMVNMKKLGLEILAFTHTKFNPKKPIYKRVECIKKIIQMQTPILNASSDLESVMLTPYRNFEDYQRIHNEITSLCVQNEFLREEPTTLLMSIPMMTIVKNHTCAPLVKKILEI
ncbi:MAG: Lrp/AsnC family transcriptional regulator [Thermoplasmatales archaeon]|nr:Lrp/AsnC family transcriptional regulator [Thermoplasmatales archaeon]